MNQTIKQFQIMKRLKHSIGIIGGAFLLGVAALGQETQADRVSVPLRDSSRPALVKANLMTGGITVKGYDGKEVVVEARLRKHGSDDEEKPDKKTEGLKRIGRTSHLPGPWAASHSSHYPLRRTPCS